MLQGPRNRERTLVSLLLPPCVDYAKVIHFLCRDPRFIREFKAKYCMEVFVEHLPTKKKYLSVLIVCLHFLNQRFIGRSSGVVKTSPSSAIRIRSRTSRYTQFHQLHLTLSSPLTDSYITLLIIANAIFVVTKTQLTLTSVSCGSTAP